ncbi:MAG: 2TM domain-containing protein [Alphaproteobacteria bacterium]|nr:2TM domain-containing protein [Alphaproteobacteria bacterium]
MRPERMREMERRRGLRLHLIAAMCVLLVAIAVNAATNPRYPWWLWLLMAWMPLIAGHTGWAMGLFGRKGDRS